MTKRFFFTITLLCSISALFAQSAKDNNAIIKGTITTSDGKPAVNVTIRIDHTKWGDISNENGEYTIKNVKPGNWTLKVSAVAAGSQEKTITIVAAQTLQLDFVLNQNAAQLQEVIVLTKNSRKEVKSVARIPLKNLENPQVYSSVSSEILKQQGITNYDDAMRNVPGISRTWESTGRAGDGASYFALRGFDAQPIMYNGLPGITSGNLDPANVEEIQVIKGPSGTLFGGNFYSYGGIINTITKKPYYDFGGEVAYNFGSFGLNRVTADINTPLSKTEKIALRVNTAYHSENSFQDAGFKKSFFVAPSLSYEVNDRLSFSFMTEILNEERAVPPVFFHNNRDSSLDFKTVKELNLNNYLSFTSNDLTIKNSRYNLQGQMLYKLSDQWTSQTVFSRGSVKSEGIYTYIWDDVARDNWFEQYFHNENNTINTTDIQQNFNGDFKIGKMRNRVLIGLDYFNRNVIDNGSGTVLGRSVTPQGDTMNAVDLSRATIDNLLAGSGINNSNISNSTYSAYVSDVINFTPGLMAMVSLRADYFESKGEKATADDDFEQFALSPKFGLVYQPVLNKVSVFANYMNAFINVNPRETSDKDGNSTGMKSFKPEHANQWEFGVKTNLLDDKLSATISVYDIRVADRVVPLVDNKNDYRQGGKVSSKGIEFEMSAHLLPGLNLIAGYSHNEIKNLEGSSTDFYTEPGRAPGGQGPSDLANLWATYKITEGKLKNFGLGLGGNYAGEYKVIDNSVTGVFNLPGYTLINGSVFYNSNKFRITLNVNNINNAEYYIGYWSINPQKQRNFAASFAYKF
ncbi:iron complex outermembrane recepter protein [Chitinophaga sp. CF118]|uniref:TonB-dependent receptor n=1 Tax=Chitinophaga sp. CF118 TaxID=1884367 RepID=UPI0008E8A55C|nr:TonB-dependent receptor [Chitinophaga sp. CF118]SFD15120.1 iron complex outermembrane recepter protein [Chitinophaga sp. CF118]